MKTKQILIFILTITLVLIAFASPSLFAQGELTAPQVMEKMDARDDGNTRTSDITMILLNKNKQQRIRKIKNISKDYGKDTKGIIFFLSPADVKNTAYMSFDFDDNNKEGDSWLYLPALKKVKRLASSDKSGSFMGSDFSYSDINGITIEDWDYKFIKESLLVDGVDTWVIQGLPKADKKNKILDETGYLKSLIWVRKDNFMLAKAKYWVKKGKKIKYLKVEDIKKTDNIWTAYKMTMTTTVKGKVEHTSLLKLANVQYNKEIDDSYFTTRNMERGL
ncbi:MAG: outer membrane lipoprotein-sorting protein [Desulfobacteraceae bacterium]|nr:outer membrane lipoprotein-sorting protein [Desulfobacteraceae bacterium]